MRALPLLSIWICCVGRPVSARLHMQGASTVCLNVAEGTQVGGKHVAILAQGSIPGCWDLLQERSGLAIVRLSSVCGWHRWQGLQNTTLGVIK
jgi:hypothetical protein